MQINQEEKTAAHLKAILPESLGDGSRGGRPPERLLLPDSARDAAGWATARAHAIMAAHKRESLQNETGLRGTRRWATRVEEHEGLLGLPTSCCAARHRM